MPKNTSQVVQDQPPKARYRITNWSEYNTALIQRGSLTIWFNVDTLEQWRQPTQTGKRGHPFEYGDIAITCALTLRAVYGLALRQTQGFLASLLELVKLPWEIPHYTTLCRRQKTLDVLLPRQTAGKAFHLVVDATGLKVYGEGEWQVNTHGKTRRRVWRKIHLGLDEATGDLVACEVTDSGTHDTEELPEILDQVEDPIAQVSTRPTSGAEELARMAGPAMAQICRCGCWLMVFSKRVLGAKEPLLTRRYFAATPVRGKPNSQ